MMHAWTWWWRWYDEILTYVGGVVVVGDRWWRDARNAKKIGNHDGDGDGDDGGDVNITNEFYKYNKKKKRKRKKLIFFHFLIKKK